MSRNQNLISRSKSGPRLYLVVLVFLETGMKAAALSLTQRMSIFRPYRPKSGSNTPGNRPKRIETLPCRAICGGVSPYLAQYRIEDALFPIPMLINCSLRFEKTH